MDNYFSEMFFGISSIRTGSWQMIFKPLPALRCPGFMTRLSWRPENSKVTLVQGSLMPSGCHITFSLYCQSSGKLSGTSKLQDLLRFIHLSIKSAQLDIQGLEIQISLFKPIADGNCWQEESYFLIHPDSKLLIRVPLQASRWHCSCRLFSVVFLY